MTKNNTNKKKTRKAVFFVLLLLLLAVGACLLFAGGEQDNSSVFDESVKPSSLLLQASQNRFRVYKGAQTELTVTSREIAEGSVTITDELGETVLTLELKDGTATGTIDVFEEEPRCMKLTACMGEDKSQPLSLYVTPEITAEMVMTGVEVSEELGQELAAQGFEKIDADALAAAEIWLNNDTRVEAVVPMDNGIFYYTTDGIAGACMLTPEEGMFGSSLFSQEDCDTLTAYTAWESGERNDYQYIWSDNTLTNDRILVLRPRYDRYLKGIPGFVGKFSDACIHNENHAQIASEIAEKLDVAPPEICSDENAVLKIIGGEINEYGIILINTHGWMIGPDTLPEEEKLFTFQLAKHKSLRKYDASYEDIEKVLGEDLGIAPDDYWLFFTKYEDDALENLQTSMLFICVADLEASLAQEQANINAGITEDVMTTVGFQATENLIATQYQNKMFDNSILYWGVCNSMTSTNMAQFLVDHGVSACVGYEGDVNDVNEAASCKAFFNTLLEAHSKEPRTKNVQESCERNNLVLHEIRRGIESVHSFVNFYFFQNENEDQHNMHAIADPADYTLSGTGTLSGTVQMDQTGEPVGGALVELYRWLNQEFVLVATTSTTGKGTFKAEDIPWGVYVVKVTSEEGEPAYADCILAAEEWDGGTIRINGLSSYYEYIRDELKPKLGLFEQGEEEMSVNDMNAQGWDMRTGILSAAIQDMNADGIDDMVLLRVELEDRKGWNLQTLYADMYTMENGKVVLKDSIKLDVFNNCENHDTWVAMYDTGEGYDLFVQSYSEAVLTAGNDPVYARYSFDGEALRKVFRIEQTEGGTTEKVYSGTKYNAQTDKDETATLWTDMMLWDFVGQGLYNSLGYKDVPSMYWAYLEENMGMKAPGDMYSYPSYIAASKFAPVAEFKNSGVPVGGLGGEFTMAVWDHTNLLGALEAIE